MPRWAAHRISLAIAIASACSFDSGGYGPHHGSVMEGSSDDAGVADDEAPASDDANVEGGANDSRTDDGGGTTPIPTDEGGPTGDPATDDGSGVDAGRVDSTSGGSESTGADEPDCPTDVLTLLWAEQADVGLPMELVPTDANMDPEVAMSVVAESGTVTFSIDFACPGQYAIWGLVWDYAPGAYGTDDPDSFYVGIGGPEATWRYGCQTAEVDSGLSWQRLMSLDAQPCDASPLVIDVAEASTVELSFRNREAGDGSMVAGISAIVVASDAMADPAGLYTPY
jgi:hypothetical protein